MPQLTIKEEFGSRDGSARGVMGINEPRHFLVTYIHGASERTELTKPDPRGFVEASYPYGSTNPWNGYSRAIGYVLVETLTHQTWRVRVDYGVGGPMAATLNPDHTRWNLSARTVGISRQLFEEPTQALESWKEVFDDRPVLSPGPTGTVGIGPLIPDNRTTFLMGTTKFAPRTTAAAAGEPPPGPNFYIKIGAGKTEVVPVGHIRIPFEYSDELPGLAYTMTRTFANFKFNDLGRIAEYKKTLNNTWFLGGAPGHVRCEDVVLDQVGTVIENGATQGEPGIGCRCSASFVWSALPFIGPGSPLALVPTVRDADGGEAIVYRKKLEGESPAHEYKVVEYLFPIRGKDFGSLIHLLESFASPLRRGIAQPIPTP